MLIQDFASLSRLVEEYIERSDLNLHIPAFIQLAETKLSRRLNLAENEVQARLDLVQGRAPLPNDYAAWRAVNGSPGWSLGFLPPHLFLSQFGGHYGFGRRGQGDGYDFVADGSWSGNPRWFTILGSIPLDDVDGDISAWVGGLDRPFLLTAPAWGGPVSFVYRQGVAPLSDDMPSNWLLRKAPDLYLYATLMETEAFLRDDPRIPKWRAMMEEGISDVQALDREARWGRSRVITLGATP